MGGPDGGFDGVAIFGWIFKPIITSRVVSGLHSPHEGLASGSGQSMSGLAYYQPEHPVSSGVVKYPENGHDTLSDFVTFVCQEAENTQQLPQVAYGPRKIRKSVALISF